MLADTSSPSDALWAGVSICLITGCAHLIGSAVFFGLVSGPFAILFSPLLSIFGWFFVVPEFLGVGLLWLAFDPRKGPKNFWMVMAGSVLVAGASMALLGPKEEGHQRYWMLAYAVAAAVSAALSLVAIRCAKKMNQQRTRGSSH
jgi:hypothetical protein